MRKARHYYAKMAGYDSVSYYRFDNVAQRKAWITLRPEWYMVDAREAATKDYVDCPYSLDEIWDEIRAELGQVQY